MIEYIYTMMGLSMTSYVVYNVYSSDVFTHIYKLYECMEKLKSMNNQTNYDALMSMFNLLLQRYRLQHTQEVFTHEHEKVGKNHYLIKYTLDGIEYKTMIRKRRGPSKIVGIYNEDDVDVTDAIKVFLGPNDDFHNIKYKPSIFKMRRLRFKICHPKRYDEEDVLTFENDEDIILPWMN